MQRCKNRKTVVLISSFLLVLLLALAGCSAEPGAGEEPPATEELPVIDADDAEEPQEMSEEERRETMNKFWEMLNNEIGPAEPYEHLGIAYYFDEEGGPRDGYIPCGRDTSFAPDGIYGKNHGVSISLYLTREYADAAEALDDLVVYLPLSSEKPNNIQYHDIGGSLADNDTVGLRVYGTTGTLDNGEEIIALAAAYADIRDNGYYMIATIGLNAIEFDDETAALITEINDCYAISLPVDEAGMWQAVR